MGCLYTFGCSYTQYRYPTWADILGKQFDHYENWGQAGAGNEFIFNSINECIVRNKITSDDTFVVMWSSITREDRYLNNRWITSGNIFNNINKIFSSQHLRQLTDIKGYLIRDLAFIHATKKMLEHVGVKHFFLSMLPIVDVNSDGKKDALIDNVDQIIEPYKDVVNFIRPDVVTTLSNMIWENESYSNLYSFKELKDHYEIESHPTPLLHLIYLNKTLPEFQHNDETVKWVLNLESLIRANKDITQSWTPKYPKVRY